MMRKTPQIAENSKGYSAIVKELSIKNTSGEPTSWVPKDQAGKYTNYAPTKIITKNGTYTPDEGYDAFKEVRLEIAPDPADIISTYSVTKNGTYNIPEDEGMFGARQVDVNVVFDSRDLDAVKIYKNGQHEAPRGLGFKEIDTTGIREELPPNPAPEDVQEYQACEENGTYQPESPYLGIGEVWVGVTKDERLMWTRKDDDTFPTLSSKSAAVFTEDPDTGAYILNIFNGSKWYKINVDEDPYEIETVSLGFPTSGLSAFEEGGRIHLFGWRNTGDSHKVYDNGIWFTANPFSPSSVHPVEPVFVKDDNGTVYMVGAGDDPSQACAQNIYRYNPIMDDWTAVVSLIDPLYRTTGAVYWMGKIHVWGPAGVNDVKHYVCDPTAGTCTLEEFNVSDLFKMGIYTLLPVVSGMHGNEVLMINAGYSGGTMNTIASCRYDSVNHKYIYKTEGFLPYNRNCSDGVGQNAVMVGNRIHVFGQNNTSTKTHYVGNFVALS